MPALTLQTTLLHPGCKWRVNELNSLPSVNFDFNRLIRLCEELNSAYEAGSYISCAFLLRAILDHVPPLFEMRTFPEVVANYSRGKSFKEAMQNLDSFSRKIADHYLHGHIRRKDSLPTAQQVNFTAALDLLLGEIASISKSETENKVGYE